MILPKVADPGLVTGGRRRRPRLGAAACAIKAVRAAAPDAEAAAAGRRECRWQRDRLPEAIRVLVLDDQRLRKDLCRSALDC